MLRILYLEFLLRVVTYKINIAAGKYFETMKQK